MEKKKNQFCLSNDLVNEASVESLFVNRLLKYLDYPDSRISFKESISQVVIGKGHKKENYKPDYILYDSASKPIIIIDAKSPTENPVDFHYQISGYALSLNQKYPDENPIRYTVLTNGYKFIVYPWDSEEPIFYLTFENFQIGDEKLKELHSNLSYNAFKQVGFTQKVFKFEKPELSALIKTFNDCHNLIRKKDSLSPTDAFYEFSKLMFIKIREDNKIHNKIKNGFSPSKESFVFSTNWIQSQIEFESNPFDAILFRQIRDELEKQIKKGEKKRIFAEDERLNLKKTTIDEIVKELQYYDLYGIDEDLNGRMFETFLNATVRGKELGQFFTPRGVVHYMVETAPLFIRPDPKKEIDENIPYVLDACCGSGGFLIDSMAELMRALNKLTKLTNTEKNKYAKTIKNSHLYGVDSTEKITRIARLNMYLHGDGGSKIYKADALD